MNLPEGYFNDDFGQVRHLPTFKMVIQEAPASPRFGIDKSDNVITFEPKKSAG